MDDLAPRCNVRGDAVEAGLFSDTSQRRFDAVGCLVYRFEITLLEAGHDLLQRVLKQSNLASSFVAGSGTLKCRSACSPDLVGAEACAEGMGLVMKSKLAITAAEVAAIQWRADCAFISISIDEVQGPDRLRRI